MSILISSQEPRRLKELLEAVDSPVVEDYGADLLLPSPKGLIGIQRKEASDFISSVEDGRLNRELGLLSQSVQFPILVQEGNFYFDREGLLWLNGRKQRYTKTQIRNLERSLWYIQGVRVEKSESMGETAALALEIESYFSKNSHVSLFRRPSPQSEWGIVPQSQREGWLLQGLQGVGPTLAEAIVKHFGRAPIQWSCSLEELERVDGIGRTRAGKIYGQLGGNSGSV